VLPLAEREAVELFCARSRFEPDEAIAELCRRLDDLPLAVELAAARTSVLTPAQILERVGQRLDLLKGGRDADPRQATLRTTIEWSYELLTPEEQTIFARLAVFAGGCTLDAAEKIADADLDVLQSLVEKSLLRHSDERFWMLETVRSFASERCDASSGSEALEARFVEWFVGLAEAGEAGIRAEERGWLGRLAQEQANLRAALEYSMRARDPDAFVRLAGALGVFWFFRAQLEEARRWLTVALARSEAPVARGKILPALVMAHLWQGDLDTAAQLVDQLLAIRDDLDPRTRADALHIAGIYHGFRGSFSAATELYEASAAISRETENTWLLRQTLNNLGDAALNQDDLELAERYFEEAVAVANDRGGDGPRAGAIAAFGGLATVAAARGDNALARQRFRSMLALVRDSDYREVGVIGPMLIHIAAFALDDGEVEASRRLLAAVDVFFAEVGMAMLTALDRRVYDRTSEGIRLNSTDAREPPAAADRATDLEAALELAEAVCA
jgi:non-specific serine/threonine protein kinase